MSTVHDFVYGVSEGFVVVKVIGQCFPLFYFKGIVTFMEH